VTSRQVLVEAFCPNRGKTYGYRAGCQIQVVTDEMKDEGGPDAQRNDPQPVRRAGGTDNGFTPLHRNTLRANREERT